MSIDASVMLSSGKAPLGWELRRIKDVARYWVSNVDKVPSEDELPVQLCNYTDVYNNPRIHPDLPLMQTTATADEIKKFGLHVGDVVITKDSESWKDIAVPALVESTAPDLVCGYHLAIIRSDPQQLNSRFLLRLLQSCAVNVQFQIASKGVTRYGLPKSSIGEARIPIPPLDEQRAIANFLDRETAKIDDLIAKKKQLIKLLSEERQTLVVGAVSRGLPQHVHLRDSGLPWLGAVPAYWPVAPLKRWATFLNYKRVPLSSEERASLAKEYPYYGASGIIDYVDGYLFDEPAILIAEDGANLYSRSTPLAFIATGKYWVNNHAHILKPREGSLLFWQERLNSIVYDPFITGSAQPKLTIEALANIRFAAPGSEQQQKIAEYIETVDASVNRTREAVQRAILLLMDARSSLITAAVTGQMDVRTYRKEPEARLAAVCP